MSEEQKYFEQKFKECSKFLKSNPKDIISLKYKEFRDNYYYTELLDQLNNIDNVKINNIGNAMNGKAFKISYGEQNIIIVEHETGLEVLCIAGSIASLVSLVLYVSSMINDHRKGYTRFPNGMRSTEIRYFDKKGNFRKEYKANYIPTEIFLLPQAYNQEIESLKQKIVTLEKKIEKLTSKQRNIKKRK